MKLSTACWALAALAAPSGVLADIKAFPVHGLQGRELCIAENLDVQENFRTAMQRAIEARGYTVRFVPTKSDCPVTMTFTAVYAMSGGYRRVLKSSVFIVYRDSEAIGSVTHRFSRRPFGNGTVEDVINKMAEQLLPSTP
jgi:hypothetical protein